MFSIIKSQCDELVRSFDKIPAERKEILEKLSAYMKEKKDEDKAINLVYICTHNSRRSHFGQIWAAVAASYYHIPNVHTYSGGTEATAFHPNAINALKNSGFVLSGDNPSPNPIYKVYYGEDEFVTCFSKVYDDPTNPKNNFAAIMTCSDAEENCPFIPGVELRIGTSYEDPKEFDGTAKQDEKYLERSRQIAREILFTFSTIK